MEGNKIQSDKPVERIKWPTTAKEESQEIVTDTETNEEKIEDEPETEVRAVSPKASKSVAPQKKTVVRARTATPKTIAQKKTRTTLPEKKLNKQVKTETPKLKREYSEFKEEKQRKTKEEEYTRNDKIVIGFLALATLLILFNQWQIYDLTKPMASAVPAASATHAGKAATLEFKEGEVSFKTYGPALLAQGEQAVLNGYRTKIKEFQTISGSKVPKATGDPVQDGINQLVPTGTPEYGQKAGVTFDDPIGAQRVWGAYERSISLTPEQQERWNGIVGKFTCDYCCGSPSNPTIITHCGCAHARAWRGMAKWFLANGEYTDEQIIGELSKWKALWYPGPTVQRVLQEQAQAGQISNFDASALPTMVGGC